MLKKNIIKKNFEFQDIINSKVQVVSKTLILYYRKNNRELRIGISVSKKFGNAVLRNRQRRQVRSILDELNMYEIKMDAVLILRKSFLMLDYQIKKQHIEKILKRIKDAK